MVYWVIVVRWEVYVLVVGIMVEVPCLIGEHGRSGRLYLMLQTCWTWIYCANLCLKERDDVLFEAKR